MESMRKRVKMAESIKSYKDQLKAISAQLATVKIQINSIVNTMLLDAAYTTADKLEVKPISTLVNKKNYADFITSLKNI